jgi:signal peptidase
MSSRYLPKIQHFLNGRGLNVSKKTITRGSVADKKHAPFFFCAYKGFSMNPTLCESDLLDIEAYIDRPIRIGDIICFLPPAGDQPIVHRVASVTPVGIRTKGDNTSLVDPWVVQPEDVIGRVIRATRGKTRRIILYGGTVGRLWSRVLRGFKLLEHGLSFFYHRLAQSGFFRYLVPLQQWMRIIAVKSATGREFKLLLGRWVVGWYKPEMIYWQIRRPFRLFVDERSLPR